MVTKNMHALIFMYTLLFSGAVWAAPQQKAENPMLAPKQCRGMVEIPAGEFLFGDTYAAANDLPGVPPSRVTTGAYLIDKCETTWRQYLAYYKSVLGKKASDFNIPPEALDTPVVNRDYAEARGYCKNLGKRLPSEQEWEKAARGGTETLYYWGDEWPGDDNAYEWNIEKFVNQRYYYPVGTKTPNPYGLYDMLGNVREITSGKCDKGGSIKLTGWNASCGKCGGKSPAGRSGDLGWRCVKDLAPAVPSGDRSPEGRPTGAKSLQSSPPIR